MGKSKSKLGNFFQAVWDLIKELSNRLSKLFDRIIYNRKASLVVSLVFAVMLCISINYSELSYQFFRFDSSTLNLPSVPIEVLVDSENYEVSGMPGTADLTVEGDAADIQLVRTQNSASIRADLRNMTEGTNIVILEAVGLPSGMESQIRPSEVQVTLQKKYTKTFFIAPELLAGTNQSVSDFETPQLATKSVTIRATKEKLNSIRSVKAIVDASGHEDTFTADCPLVAYDASGRQVNVQMSPETVSATVVRKTEGSAEAEEK